MKLCFQLQGQGLTPAELYARYAPENNSQHPFGDVSLKPFSRTPSYNQLQYNEQKKQIDEYNRKKTEYEKAIKSIGTQMANAKTPYQAQMLQDQLSNLTQDYEQYGEAYPKKTMTNIVTDGLERSVVKPLINAGIGVSAVANPIGTAIALPAFAGLDYGVNKATETLSGGEYASPGDYAFKNWGVNPGLATDMLYLGTPAAARSSRGLIGRANTYAKTIGDLGLKKGIAAGRLANEVGYNAIPDMWRVGRNAAYDAGVKMFDKYTAGDYAKYGFPSPVQFAYNYESVPSYHVDYASNENIIRNAIENQYGYLRTAKNESMHSIPDDLQKLLTHYITDQKYDIERLERLKNNNLEGIGLISDRDGYIKDLTQIPSFLRRNFNKILDQIFDTSSKNKANVYTTRKVNKITDPKDQESFRLTKLRLLNGGLQKVGIYPGTPSWNAIVNVKPIVNEYIPDEAGGMFTLKTEPLVYGPGSDVLPELRDIYKHDSNGNLIIPEGRVLMPNIMDAKEFVMNDPNKNGVHAYPRIEVSKNAGAYGDVAAHEYNHLFNTYTMQEPMPKTDLSAFADEYSMLGRSLEDYMTHGNGTDILSRFTQLKNYFGLRNGYDVLTPEHLDYAIKHYIEETGVDNWMTQFFKWLDMNRDKWDIILRWANKYSAYNDSKKPDNVYYANQGGLIQRRKI